MNRMSLALAGVALGALAVPVFAAPAAAPAAAATAKPAPVASLIKQVDIPYQQFTLANGLRVIVHTDRKAPIVAVSVWYDVGSKHEPKGKTGFAHLFEHLMFNGQRECAGRFLRAAQAGRRDRFQRHDLFRPHQLFRDGAESARSTARCSSRATGWGYLIGAITQGVLDEQRGVVQNEKRQGDNQPYGLVDYELIEGLFPDGHPYRPYDDRIDGRSRRRQPRRREELVPRALRPEQRGPRARRRHRLSRPRSRWSRSISATSRAAPTASRRRRRRAGRWPRRRAK